jgi:hypothetical protein
MNRTERRKQERIQKKKLKKAQKRMSGSMPSFIVRLNVDENFNVTYDNTGLVEKQISFVDTCINQLKGEAVKNIKDPTNAFGYVFWGKADDFAGHLSEPKTGVDIDAFWTELKDSFFSQYWETTNQNVELSETFCKAVLSNTGFVPIGATLDSVKEHEYSNFAISVAYTKHFANMSKVGGKSFGDMAPPEVDPNSKCYSPNYVEKVKQALSNFGIEIEADWKPGSMMTKLIAI